MPIQAKYTRKQISIMLDSFVSKNNRLPTPEEFAAQSGYNTTKCNQEIGIYRKGLIQLFVHPVTKKVLRMDGTTVWRQNTAGSLMPASFRDGGEMGLIIY